MVRDAMAGGCREGASLINIMVFLVKLSDLSHIKDQDYYTRYWRVIGDMEKVNIRLDKRYIEYFNDALHDPKK